MKCMYVLFVTNPTVAAKSNKPLLNYLMWGADTAWRNSRNEGHLNNNSMSG